jgi:hypothetical protein
VPHALLATRALPLDLLESGRLLFRIHATVHEPIYFGRAASQRLSGRWDAPDQGYGVCYLADAAHPYVAFAERFLREPGRTLIPESELRRASLTTLILRRDIQVVRFHGSGLGRLGATAEIAHGDHRLSRPWSLRLHAHPAAPAGIRWRARHDDDGLAIALFERAAGTLEVVRSAPLLSAEVSGMLTAWLERYQLGVVAG